MTVASAPVNATYAELVAWAFEQLNHHDVSALRNFWNDDTVERFPDRTCHGADEIVSYFEEAFAAISDFHMEVLAIAEQDDDVFVHWRLTGVHDGALLGVAPTHKPVAIDGMDHFVIRDGEVLSNFVVFDQMQYARQLGLMPARRVGRRQGSEACVQRPHQARGETQALSGCQLSHRPALRGSIRETRRDGGL